MKIKTSKRVVYINNPLVEVLCQVRFDRILRLQSAPPHEFQDEIAGHYPNLQVQDVASFQVLVGGTDRVAPLDGASIPSIYHFTSEDGERKVSVCADFFAYSCQKYESWQQFSQQFYFVLEIFLRHYPLAALRRTGLRYKDLIERERLGLSGVHWRDLLAPFIAGVLAADELFEGGATIEDEPRIEQSTQATLRLDDCAVLLRTALLRSNDEPVKHAFLIDADFFHEAPDRAMPRGELETSLETLHKSANALFGACVKPKLHNALGPIYF